MLATAGAPPLGPGWTAEAKWDGARATSLVCPSGVELVSRPGNNFATRFPDVTSALQTALAGHIAILDGEIVALGNDGRPDFARLQEQSNTENSLDIYATRPGRALSTVQTRRWWNCHMLSRLRTRLTTGPVIIDGAVV